MTLFIIRHLVTVGTGGITIIVFITIHGVILPGDIMIHGMPVHSVGDIISGTEAIMVMDIRDIMDMATVMITAIMAADGEVDTIHKIATA